ncbi:MAG TPA: hypothetical protein VK891_18855 [Euzebyales bacterium]|nr:hypothetical protein [Euzebyales bacterium]
MSALLTPPANAQEAANKRTAGAAQTSSGGAAWASFKQVDVQEQRSSRSVFVAQNDARERSAGSPAARLSRSQHAGRPDGCYADAIGSSAGALRLVEVCPGEGGYRGLAGEAFGVTTLVLRDPVTGELIEEPAGGIAQQQGQVVIDPFALAQRAAAVLDLPEPAMRMNPDGEQVVRLHSWLWIPAAQWEPRQVSASAGPVTSTVTATPVRLAWDMGNGDRVSCDGPGTPYRQAAQVATPACGYTYRHSSAGQPDDAYRVTATLDWELTWTASGAPGGGDLGTVSRSTTRSVPVAEVQALVQ